jgi:hypothetical protein
MKVSVPRDPEASLERGTHGTLLTVMKGRALGGLCMRFTFRFQALRIVVLYATCCEAMGESKPISFGS